MPNPADPNADCIFCRIVAGEIPAKKALEDDRAIAFHDLNPQAPTHVLVVPRKHIRSLSDAAVDDATLLGHLMWMSARVAERAGIAEAGYRTVVNTGSGSGQTVWHLHVHVLGGRALSWPPG